MTDTPHPTCPTCGTPLEDSEAEGAVTHECPPGFRPTPEEALRLANRADLFARANHHDPYRALTEATHLVEQMESTIRALVDENKRLKAPPGWKAQRDRAEYAEAQVAKMAQKLEESRATVARLQEKLDKVRAFLSEVDTETGEALQGWVVERIAAILDTDRYPPSQPTHTWLGS